MLTVSERGFGKRILVLRVPDLGPRRQRHRRHGVNDRNGPLVASFPVVDDDQIMLVTDGGQLIRCPVDDVRIAGRNTQGVRIFKTDAEEKVVSVERIPDDGSDGGDEDEATAMTATPRRRSEPAQPRDAALFALHHAFRGPCRPSSVGVDGTCRAQRIPRRQYRVPVVLGHAAAARAP